MENNIKPYKDGMRIVYAHADSTFRNHIRNGDIEGARQSMKNAPELDPYPVRESELCHATCWGHLDMVKWLVEKLGVRSPYALCDAITNSECDIALYLLEKEFSVDLGYFCTHYRRFFQKSPEEYEKYRDNQRLSPDLITRFAKRGIDLSDNEHTVLFQFIKAFATKQKYTFLRDDLFGFLLAFGQNKYPDLSDKLKKDCDYVIKSGIKGCVGPYEQKYVIKKNMLSEWMPYLKLKDGLFDEQLLKKFRPNLFEYMKTMETKYDNLVNYLLEIRQTDGCRIILDELKPTPETLNSLIYRYLSEWNIEKLRVVQQYVSDNNITMSLDGVTVFRALAYRRHHWNWDIGNDLFNILLLLGLPDTDWLLVRKELGKYDSDSMEKKMRKRNLNILQHIDFSNCNMEIVPQEKWVWISVLSEDKMFDRPKTSEGFGCTYTTYDYNEVPFDITRFNTDVSENNAEWDYSELFKIKTFEDLQNNLEYLEEDNCSVTACYYDLNEETGVFYSDQQGCVVWALDKQGRVFVHDDNNPYVITYVAKTLPEFLIRIKYENSKWRGVIN